MLAIAQLSCGGGSSMSNEQGGPNPPPPQLQLTKLSGDAFTNSTSQHATEVEPAVFANGSTLVAAFQVARIFAGGSADIGFSTSTDGGATWTNGLLPGITIFEGGTYNAVSDPSVVYDKAHATWIINSLAIGSAIQVIVSRSPDGKTWSGATVISNTPNADKNWITCDNNSGSPYFGHCYVEWDDPNSNSLIWMSTSSDGGLTWSAAVDTSGAATGVGGQPVVQPNGNVVVPILSGDSTRIIAFNSADGGVVWSAPVNVATITDHQVAGGLRTTTLPSATVDAGGRVYTVWQDCRFRAACASNDLVMSTSADGTTWSAPLRIPIDGVSSSADHFIPGLSVDPATSAGSAHLALAYYFYTQANCMAATCALNAGFISSLDGGTTWSSPTTLAGPMNLSWLPSTSSGVMVGDYVATALVGGKVYPVFAVAQANLGTHFNEAIYTTTNALAAQRSAQSRVRVARQEAILSTHSDHPAKRFTDVDEALYPPRLPSRSPEN
jgi:hypothetical protein